LVLDAKILAKTVPAVVSGAGGKVHQTTSPTQLSPIAKAGIGSNGSAGPTSGMQLADLTPDPQE
jgi:hypothetical protein